MLSRAIPLPVPASPGPAKSRAGAREEAGRHLAAHLWSSMGHWSPGWTDGIGIGLTLAAWQLPISPPPSERPNPSPRFEGSYSDTVPGSP